VATRPTSVIAAAILAVSVALAACGSDGGSSAGHAGPSAALERGSVSRTLGDPIRLSVLVFNVEYGGTPATDKAIRRADADVVGVLESYKRLPKIAENTGYRYYNVSLQLLSRYPIYEPSGAHGLYALIEVRPGYVIPFFNEHLDYVAWGPRALRHGASVASVIRTENEVRTQALARPMKAMGELTDEGYPVLLTGDLNEPSSLDYAKETVGTRSWVHRPVRWPVSEALFRLGFHDSYREVHPDPLKMPGITHPRSHERIDYVYASGPARTRSSKIVGEKGGRDVSIAVSPWTSDHRAVLSTFEVRPAPIPPMVAVNARLGTVGDMMTVAYNAPTSNAKEIAIVRPGGDPDSPPIHLSAEGARGTEGLDTSRLKPGRYVALLLDDGGDPLDRIGFVLRGRHPETTISTDRRTYRPGEPIRVRWVDGPANRWDWLAVYRASASNPRKDDYKLWDYTWRHASGTLPPRTNGSLTLGPNAQGNPWPLPPGRYVVHYLLADQYHSAAATRFSVRR
jgi:endonuclease/exonuclease/phosphatase family metal-dependent hydrolase